MLVAFTGRNHHPPSSLHDSTHFTFLLIPVIIHAWGEGGRASRALPLIFRPLCNNEGSLKVEIYKQTCRMTMQFSIMLLGEKEFQFVSASVINIIRLASLDPTFGESEASVPKPIGFTQILGASQEPSQPKTHFLFSPNKRSREGYFWPTTTEVPQKMFSEAPRPRAI